MLVTGRDVPAGIFFCIFTFGKFLMGIGVSLQEGLLRVFELNMTCLEALKWHFCGCLVWAGVGSALQFPISPHFLTGLSERSPLDTACCILDPEKVDWFFFCGLYPSCGSSLLHGVGVSWFVTRGSNFALGSALYCHHHAGAPLHISFCCVDAESFQSKLYSSLKSILGY